METESNVSVLASQPSSATDISMLMTHPRVGAASNAFGSVVCLGVPHRDERRRSEARMTGTGAQDASPRARIIPMQVEKSAQVRSAFDFRQGSDVSAVSVATNFVSLDSIYVPTGASADDAGTAYGSVRFQEHPPAA